MVEKVESINTWNVPESVLKESIIHYPEAELAAITALGYGRGLIVTFPDFIAPSLNIDNPNKNDFWIYCAFNLLATFQGLYFSMIRVVSNQYQFIIENNKKEIVKVLNDLAVAAIQHDRNLFLELRDKLQCLLFSGDHLPTPLVNPYRLSVNSNEWLFVQRENNDNGIDVVTRVVKSKDKGFTISDHKLDSNFREDILSMKFFHAFDYKFEDYHPPKVG